MQLSALQQLTDLDISSNRVRELGHDFGALRGLWVLDAADNQLERVSAGLVRCVNLTDVDFSRNKIRTLAGFNDGLVSVGDKEQERMDLAALERAENERAGDDAESKLFAEKRVSVVAEKGEKRASEAKGEKRASEAKGSGETADGGGGGIGVRAATAGRRSSAADRRGSAARRGSAMVVDEFVDWKQDTALRFGVNELYGVCNKWDRVTSLDLSNNQLEFLPQMGFGQMTALTECFLHHNRLRSVPLGILRLGRVRELPLYQNLLETFPGPLVRLSSLVQLELSHNLLREVRAAAVLRLHRVHGLRD